MQSNHTSKWRDITMNNWLKSSTTAFSLWSFKKTMKMTWLKMQFVLIFLLPTVKRNHAEHLPRFYSINIGFRIKHVYLFVQGRCSCTSVWPKFGIGFGNQNQDWISVLVLEPKFYFPKPKFFFQSYLKLFSYIIL